MVKSIKDLLNEYFKGSNLEKVNNSINIQKTWKKVVGELIYKNTEIKNYKDKKLSIKVSNPIWRNELFFQKEELIEKLNKSNPNHEIKEIFFK